MYDELAKRLRHSANFAERGLTPPSSELYAAADAIEELSKQLDDMNEANIALYGALPRWIPVTERLPNGEAKRYLVAASLTALDLWVSICYYADNLEEVDEYEFEDEKRGGFYLYDYEYGYCEKLGVQYWMPLPEPPKEAK